MRRQMDGGLVRRCRAAFHNQYRQDVPLAAHNRGFRLNGSCLRVGRTACLAFVSTAIRSTPDRNHVGTIHKAPALSRLCPVAGYEAWLGASGLADGPVFRRIDRWGRTADNGRQASSIVPLLRALFHNPGLPHVQNMTCELCPITVKKSLQKVPVVSAVKIDFAKKTATVTYDPDQAQPETLIRATTNAGYPSIVRP